MAEQAPQSLANHTRFDPRFHFFLAPLSLATFIAGVWHAIRDPSFVSIWMAVASLLIFFTVFMFRTYSLKVQDRVIRLEERLRLASLLPDSQRAKIVQLTEGQLIALRFASDAELAPLAVRAIDEKLAPGDIKKSIRNWRGDYFRV
ncbi:MAG TPA: DUF6526 family protein [Bryobacteraceae bacterium]|jgi:hypothetical protein